MHGPAVTGVLESVGSCSTAFQCFVCKTLESSRRRTNIASGRRVTLALSESVG
jgi:hypothetical protein